MSVRPNSSLSAVSRRCGAFARAFARAVAAVVVGGLVVAPSSGGAQGAGATQSSSPRVTLTASVATPVRAIVLVRPIGSPVTLADGRVEQRIQVVANAPFVLAATTANAKDVTWTDGQRERPLDSFAGSPGVYNEIRVISRGESTPQLAARAASPAQISSLGSGDSQ